jgi:hypothetical protein
MDVSGGTPPTIETDTQLAPALLLTQIPAPTAMQWVALMHETDPMPSVPDGSDTCVQVAPESLLASTTPS